MSTITLPGTGEVVGTDTVSGEKVPLGKLLVGSAGTGTMVSDSNPLPVIQEIGTDTVAGEEIPLSKILVGDAGVGTMVSAAAPLPITAPDPLPISATDPLAVVLDTETDTVSGDDYQISKIAFGDASTLTRVSQATPLPVMGLDELVALGLVPGWSIMQGMGEREDMAVVPAGEDICRMNELSPAPSNVSRLLTPSTSGEALSIYCEDATDTAAGVGIQEVTIDYIDTSYAAQSTTVATNGGTASTGITDAVFVNDIYA
ncbi:MAG: hypothetical protein GY941_01810, partial [Planctomycetes bacterium]|nr:hypothetical protein [Planctomycetota bacterium]